MKKLIVFGEDWGAHPSSTQYLISGLQPCYDVVWVNSIGLRRPRLSSADIKRILGKGGKILKQLADHEGTPEAPFPVINAAAIPWPGSPMARRINGALIRKSLRPFLDSKRHPLLWISLPSAVDVIGRLDERAVVYYCGDDFSSLAGVDHEAVEAMEKELVQKADLIIAASEVLAGKFPAGKTHIIQHGVDFELFSAPQPRPSDLPDGKPIAGFYGSIAEWVDLELIGEAARALPEWDFVIIGPARVDFTSLTGFDNIHFLGPRPHDRLPGYVQHWKAALLPFRLNGQIEACNPLKLREYLASGAHVVTTGFPALKGYEDVLRIATSVEEFVTAIEECGSMEGKNDEGMLRVAGEGWSDRVRDLEALLEPL